MDDEIAALLNKHFVCIKVDREERPDIDEIYMTALQVYLQADRVEAGRRLAAVDVSHARRQAAHRRHLLSAARREREAGLGF